MSWQHFDPPAIIIPAPPRAEIQAPSIKKELVFNKEHFKKVYDTPWNKVQPDGRINIDGESSASISPYSMHFRSQVEDGIWSLVETLHLKGYLPISSCAGHRGNIFQEFERSFFEYSSCPYVTIAINRDCEKSIVNSLEKLSVEHVIISVAHTQANMDASKAADGKIKKTRRKNIENEYWSLNWMLQRNYAKWSYITIRINPWKRFSVSHVLRTQRENDIIDHLSTQYKGLPDYVF